MFIKFISINVIGNLEQHKSHLPLQLQSSDTAILGSAKFAFQNPVVWA